MPRVVAAAFIVLSMTAKPPCQAAEEEPNIQVVPEEVVGIALYPDGETPVPDLPVVVWHIDKRKIVYRTRTDDKGIFEVPRMRTGRCLVFVGRVRVDMQVLMPEGDTLAQHHDLIVVIPRRMLINVMPTIRDVIMGSLIVAPLAFPPVVSP